jgi:hypothetical protein
MSRPRAIADTGLTAHLGTSGFIAALRMPRVALTHAVYHRSAPPLARGADGRLTDDATIAEIEQADGRARRRA